MGINGNASTTFGGNQGLGNYTAGVGMDYLQKYRFDLKYNGYFGSIATNAADQITSYAGLTALMRDRGNISFSLRAGLQKWSFTKASPFQVALKASNVNVKDLTNAAGVSPPSFTCVIGFQFSGPGPVATASH